MIPAVADAVTRTCEVTTEHAGDADRDARFPVEALTVLRETGLLGLMVPAELGGFGGDVDDLVDVTIELGRADLSVALVFAMHCQQAAAVARFGSEQLRKHVLPRVASGELYLASVTTEDRADRNLLSSSSPTTLEAGWLRLDRDAPLVTGGRHADAFLMTMQTPGATTPGAVDLVYAERGQLEVVVTGGWNPLGMRATESVPMRLSGEVPAWQVVGEPSGFRTLATTYFAPVAHIGWAASWLGTAVGACSRVVEYARGQSGRRQLQPTSELVLTRLADVRSRLDTVHALLRHTVQAFTSCADAGAANVQLLLNTLKTESSVSCACAVEELVELVGVRHGYMRDSPLRLERALRDIRSATLNYRNDRLRLANGTLALMDSRVSLA
jgi:acyl-CoA dehydrogenase